jgi:catechol 2,3-dioxygenase-like lactoylglutathione lyase family enzyme
MNRSLLLACLAIPAFAQETHLDHVHLNVKSRSGSEAFYAARFEPGPLRFEEVQQPAPADLTSAIWHIGWGALDVRAEYQRQLGLGTRYTTAPTNLAEVGPQFFYSYVEGPDREMIELNTNRHNRFGHIHLLSEDPIAAAEWYMKHLGLKTMNGRPLSRQVVRLGGSDIGQTANLVVDGVYLGIFPASWARGAYRDDWKGVDALVSTAGRVIDHIAFSVPDLPATLASLRASGAKFLNLPRRGGDTGVYVEGPDRIVLELVAQPPKP